jgi:hypothetical protein
MSTSTKRTRRRAPSPALVVAVVALVLAATGSATALSGSGSSPKAIATGGVNQTHAVAPAGAFGAAQVNCDPGEVATGGGGAFDNNATDVRNAVVESFPLVDPACLPVGWEVLVFNNGGGSEPFTVYAVCAT